LWFGFRVVCGDDAPYYETVENSSQSEIPPRDGGRSAGPSAVRVAAGVLLIALLLVGAFLARNAYESRRWCRLAREAEVAGRLDDAILHYRHAVEMHTAGLGAADRALDGLARVARRAAGKDDVETELLALRSARWASMAARHLWTPAADRLPGIERRIAELMSVQSGHPGDARRFADQLAESHGADPRPRGLAAAVLFVVWLASLVAVVGYGFDAQARPRKRLVAIGLCSAGAFVAWLSVLF
jgi:hypothetical protein